MTELEYLVARLRSVAETEAEKYERKPQHHVCWEAADEIERLRKRIEELETIDILEKDLRTYNGY